MPAKLIRSKNAVMALGLGALLFVTKPASAVDIVDDPVQIEERVSQVIQTTNSLCWEMYRYHQNEADFRDAYTSAKELWTQATRLRELIVAGPMETETLIPRVTEIGESFLKVEGKLMQWGTGDQSSLSNNSSTTTLRTVVTPAAGVTIPFLDLQVGGGSQVQVVEDTQPLPQRLRLHANARGSKRSLERELIAAKFAVSYLMEDAGVPANSVSSPTSPTVANPASNGSTPKPPQPDASLEPREIVVPARNQQPDPNRK